MKKTILNFKKNELSKNEMKQLSGGSLGCRSVSCTLVIINPQGQYISLSGQCADGVWDNLGCYCNTGIGKVNVTSNGGISRCYQDWVH